MGNFTFKGTWKRTCLLSRKKLVDRSHFQLSLEGFSSKFLFSRWYRGNVSIEKFSTYVPSHVDKRSNLSLQEFINDYESKSKPVILQGVISKWKSNKLWQPQEFLKKYGNCLFKTNGTDEDGHCFKLTFSDYYQYAITNHDDKPLYLFDNKFLERVPEMEKEYEIPEHFCQDFFDLLTKEARPDWRWFLSGPARSGSPFHQDPHRTSAWNALITGRKRWSFYPPYIIPPGIIHYNSLF